MCLETKAAAEGNKHLYLQRQNYFILFSFTVYLTQFKWYTHDFI